MSTLTTGTDSDDRIVLGGGSDTIDGGLGSDTINAGAGGDLLTYTYANEQGVVDYYNGGSGYDSLVLDFSTYTDWTYDGWSAFEAALNQRIADFMAMVEQYKAANGDLPNLGAKSFVFDFGNGTQLQVAMVETVQVIKPVLNHAPVIEASSVLGGALVEDVTKTAIGQLVMTDLDVGDTPEASVTSRDISYTPHGGSPTTELPAGLYASTLLAGFRIDAQSGEWIYDISRAKLNLHPLAAGDRLTLTYGITVTDDFGATDSSEIAITITGTNDAPTFGIFSQLSGRIVEDDLDQVIIGGLYVSDWDQNDTLVIDVDKANAVISYDRASFREGDSGGTPEREAYYEGTMPAGGADVSVQPLPYGKLPWDVDADALREAFSYDASALLWTYDASHLDLSTLGAGDKIHLSYSITATDSEGARAATEVTVTLEGANDAPTDLRFMAANWNSQTTLPQDGDLIGSASAKDVDRFDVLSYGFQTAEGFETAMTVNGVVFSFDSFGGLTSNGLEAGQNYELNFVAKDASGAQSSLRTVHVITGGLSDYRVWGTDGDDLIYGLAAWSDLYGGDGNDTLFGLNGDNDLSGQAGDDRLYAGGGRAGLDGGEGNDVFVFNAPRFTDTIYDFVSGADKIELSTAAGSPFTRPLNISDGAFFASVTEITEAFWENTPGTALVYAAPYGALYYDTNGTDSGGLVQLAYLAGAPTLSASDFIFAP